MKASILSSSFFALCLLSGLVHSFPTAQNFAKLARYDISANHDMHESLLRLKHKRLLFDPTTEPVDGASLNEEEKSVDWTNMLKSPGYTLFSRQTSTKETKEDLVPDSMHFLIMVIFPVMALLA